LAQAILAQDMARIKLLQNLQCVRDGHDSPLDWPPWGGGVPRFAIPKDLEAAATRLNSTTSTRCPSSPTPTRSSAPPTRPSSASAIRSPRCGSSCSSKVGATLHSARERETSSGTRRLRSTGAMTERGTSRPFSNATITEHMPWKPGNHSESGGSSPKSANKEAPLPDFYRPEGMPPPKGACFLPSYKLWVTLHGGNGTWQQRKASAEWEEQQLEHRQRERERENAERALRQRRAEAERRRRAIDEELRLRVEEAERERRRRQEEEARLQAEREEAERKRRLEEERQWRLGQPRACRSCAGTGKCAACGGQGFTSIVYLSESVKPGDGCVCGRLPLGCGACGGRGDDACWGEFRGGGGRCTDCRGEGIVPAPIGGWPE